MAHVIAVQGKRSRERRFWLLLGLLADQLLILDFRLKKMGKQKCYLLICILTSELESDSYCKKVTLVMNNQQITEKIKKKKSKYAYKGMKMKRQQPKTYGTL